MNIQAFLDCIIDCNIHVWFTGHHNCTAMSQISNWLRQSSHSIKSMYIFSNNMITKARVSARILLEGTPGRENSQGVWGSKA